ncbi:hypothetical protein [Desulfotomaculum defluvii]
MRNTKFKLWFDAAMMITLCLLYNTHSTGLAFHEIAGLVLGGAVILHLFFNKDWVIGISKKIFSKNLNWKTRFSYSLNLILLIDMFFIILSGLLISKIVTPDFSGIYFCKLDADSYLFIHFGTSNSWRAYWVTLELD